MSDHSDAIEQAQNATILSLSRALQSNEDLTRMNLDDITELANDVARVVPAGNVVRMVFSQLRSIGGRRVTDNDSRRMLSLLNQGMATFLDKATYMTFYTTPAMLISGYQLLLRASGKDPDETFPHGTWQYYLEFGLREDTARHACETNGFQQMLVRENPAVSEGDKLAAWISAVQFLLLHYLDFLQEEWYERALLRRLSGVLNDNRIVSRWVARRPYGVPKSYQKDYVSYRREVFSDFVRELLLSHMHYGEVDKTLSIWNNQETLTNEDRKAYQEQMSLLAKLEPGSFNDVRVPLETSQAYIAVVWQQNYYMIPLTHNRVPLDRQAIRVLAHAILSQPPADPAIVDDFLVGVPRSDQEHVRSLLPDEVRQQVEWLRHAPVVINWDEADVTQTLSQIRRGKRGIGDHALTLFRTAESVIFDQSHIFFDAIWGMATAEIVTNEAIRNLRQMQGAAILARPGFSPHMVDLSMSLDRKIARYSVPMLEVSAEVEIEIVDDINRLRRLLKQRSNDLHLTVNDILILYRSLYNQYYHPSESLARTLRRLSRVGAAERSLVRDVATMIEKTNQVSPAFLIPIDASVVNPRARIFPVTFCPRPPWTDIGPHHETVWELLTQYRENGDWRPFADQRTRYLEMLRMFGTLMNRYKEIALEGKTVSIATLKLLSGVPKRLQAMLRNIPDKIDILNDMLKGTEVFSNVGMVAETSSLTRFITAKDDNQKKELCWGVMTRADGTMVISLRDFRPEVTALGEMGALDVAQMITQDFLDGYARGLHNFVYELTEIVKTRKRRNPQ